MTGNEREARTQGSDALKMARKDPPLNTQCTLQALICSQMSVASLRACSTAHQCNQYSTPPSESSTIC